MIIIYVVVSVPTEEVKSPTFKVFPQSTTVAQGQSVVYNCEADKTPTQGIHETPLSI